ncbi:MAG: aldo/keto reductase family protein [Eubacteriales bacterium]|nr:aldo/keto reductase family protein [Eubacteriales bacterium]
MKYRRLGKTGLKVSEISLGSYLTYGQVNGEETARSCIRRAMELGINSFDTADVYGNKFNCTGSAEAVLGKILQEYPRDSYVLATKIGYPTTPGVNGGGLSRKHVREACEASLRRLGTDYVDILYLHLYDEETPVEETMEALELLVRQGKVLYTGISNWPGEAVRQANTYADRRGLTRLSVVQPPYNMFQRETEKAVFPLCREQNMGAAVYFPLAQGILAGRYTSVNDLPKDSRAANQTAGQVIQAVGCLTEENLRKVQKMTKLAKEAGMEMAQLALAWILRNPEVSTVLTGASRISQLECNVKASGIALEPALLDEIEQILAQ